MKHMKTKMKELKAKLLRKIGVTREIKLSKSDVQFIKLCKLHYRNDERFKDTNGWIETLKPMHDEIYGWSAKEFEDDFRLCMFNKLFDIYMKIEFDQSGSHAQLTGIISAGFKKTFIRDNELPIERVICELCGLIQCNVFMVDGVPRYNLDLDKANN